MPGLFEPVHHADRVLVDGRLVNLVPFDLLRKECDLVVAVDVLGMRTPDSANGPSLLENSFNSFQLMQNVIVREKLTDMAPDISIRSAIENVRVLEFYKVEQIYLEANPEANRLRSMLRSRLDR